MPRLELGTKRICPTTGRKFYDLGKSPVISPYSGEVVPIAAATTSGRYAAPVAARREAPADEEDEQEGPELVSLDEAEEGDTDTDTDSDGETAADDTSFVVDDEDEEGATGLIDVDEEEDEES
ncbi:MAG: TIGR02300 family protein [Parafilimonas terrae]|nr:TIGR02300 family protein [Parafilimonas terrae]